MTTEEKAKAYDEAIERAKNFIENGDEGERTIAESIFAGLMEESEDEKVEKAIFAMVYDSDNELWSSYGVSKGDVLAWLEKQGAKVSAIEGFETEFERQVSYLIASVISKEYEYNQGYVKWTANALLNYAKHELEKQGEQKPADKFEPKFKVGDWIINETYATIMQVVNNKDFYESVEINGQRRTDTYNYIERDFRLWTIQDAKDGDVLVNGSNIFIFHFINDTRLMGYCHVNTDDGRFYDDIGKNECFCLIDGVVNPATKEQRDTLLKAMADAEYAFDFGKKELRTIDQNLARLKRLENIWSN